MDKTQSKTIDLLRYPLAVLVVMCHSCFLDGGAAGNLSSYKLLLGIQIFFSETLPHVAVPLFLMFSGYLFFRGGHFDGQIYKAKLKSRFRTLFIPYIIWSTVCYLVLVAQGTVSLSLAHYLQGLWDTALWRDGATFSRTLPGYPVNMPLWFIRDLMVLVVLSPVIWWVLQKTRGWGLVLFAAWWFPAHDKFFGFGADSLFFFSLGALLSMKDVNFVKWVRKYSTAFYIAVGVMLVADFMVMYHNFMLYHELRFNWIIFNIYVISIMGATLALAGGKTETRLSERVIKLSGASFFLYAAHILWLKPLQDWLLGLLSPASEAVLILFYFLFIVLHIAAVTVLFYVMKRLLPKTTAFITGGRMGGRK